MNKNLIFVIFLDKFWAGLKQWSIAERTCASFLKAEENMSVKILLTFLNLLPLYLFHFTTQREIIKNILEKAVAERKFAALG